MAADLPAKSDPTPRLLWAPQAWVEGRWRDSVLLRIGVDDRWSDIECEVPCPPAAERLDGPAIPSLVDAHSHAFQRAFVGLAESRNGMHDDFWSWRERMYAVAQRITPAQLRAVAAHLYAELLAGGYTEVCEFHYLHHEVNHALRTAPHHAPNDGMQLALHPGRQTGSPLAGGIISAAPRAPDADRPAAMAQALIDAAADAGIGLTLLPVLYQRAGFAAPALRAEQERFAADARFVLAQQQAVQALARQRRARGAPASPLAAGVAIHSLRAVDPAALARVAEGAGTGPIHIHVAEQTAEVDDCLAATGCRPIEWLARHAAIDARWQLVHATHSTPAEIAAVAARGAGVVLCPTTEANLGDGLADLPGWLDAGVPLSLGSDSHVARAWTEELRWLEYGQRLHLRRRNIAARPERSSAGVGAGQGNEAGGPRDGPLRAERHRSPAGAPADTVDSLEAADAATLTDPAGPIEASAGRAEAAQPATAARLFERVRAGGGAAAGQPGWGLQRGARADLLVLDASDAALAGVPAAHRLDVLVFGSPSQPFLRVMVAGRWVGLGGALRRGMQSRFEAAMAELWGA
jgi:formimidoylglutamate deiminase